MKTKIILLAFLLLVIYTNKILGQSYKKLLKDSNSWTCRFKVNFTSNFDYTYKFCTLRTASFDGYSYRPIVLYDKHSDSKKIDTIGFLREDTINKKVYYVNNPVTTEILLYDFSLGLKDSIFLHFDKDTINNGQSEFDTAEYPHTDWYKVVKLDSVYMLGIWRKTWHLEPKNSLYAHHNYEYIWHEGIGCEKSILYNKAPNLPYRDNYNFYLQCAFQNSSLTYHYLTNRDCEFDSSNFSSINRDRDNLVQSFSINNQTCTIVSKSTISTTNLIIIYVYDITGRRLVPYSLTTGYFGNQIVTKFELPYSSGIYFVEIVSGISICTKKIILN